MEALAFIWFSVNFSKVALAMSRQRNSKTFTQVRMAKPCQELCAAFPKLNQV